MSAEPPERQARVCPSHLPVDTGALSSEDIVGLLADETRLRVTAVIVLEPATTQEVAERAELPVRQAIEALSRLETGGLVERDPQGRWMFDFGRLRDVARSARPARDAAATPAEAILQAFITDGRLTQIPAARNKRLVVLDRLAAEFEPGRHYSEREVNEQLSPWHDDVAALRRYLVDEGFLSRDHGDYWRTGGTVQINGQPA
jgi:hypothetical protein